MTVNIDPAEGERVETERLNDGQVRVALIGAAGQTVEHWTVAQDADVRLRELRLDLPGSETKR